MEWRYYGVHLTGLRKTGPHSPDQFVQRLAIAIQQRRCAQQLPAIRCSPLLGRDAYIFLAHVEDPDDLPTGIPELVKSVFGDARYVGTIIVSHDHRGGFALEEIRRFTGPNLTTDTVGSLRDLFRLPALAELAPMVLDLSALDEEEARASVDPDLAARHVRLVDWLSACGSGTWDRLVRACAALGLARLDERARLRTLIRRLMLLGHVQVSSPDPQRWSVCPLTLVASGTEADTVFVCGQQTAAVRRDLERQLGNAEYQSQPDDDGPPRLAFRSGVERAAAVTTAAGVPVRFAGFIARRLCDALPDYTGWLASLPTDGALRTAAFVSSARYDGSGFSQAAHPFEEAGRAVGHEGLYEFTCSDGTCVYRYLDSGHGVWRTGEFYSLRFAGWVAAQARASAFLLEESGRVAIPSAQRWPMLHERCLVLASGRLPRWSAEGPSMSYHGIGRDLLTRLCGKLPVDIKEPDHA
jgi:hypothetical protein